MQQLTQSPDATRVDRARTNLASLVERLRGPEFEDVHPARWRHKETGHHVETGYSYGEGRARVFLDGGRVADRQFVFSGREDDLAAFNALFPVSGV